MITVEAAKVRKRSFQILSFQEAIIGSNLKLAVI